MKIGLLDADHLRPSIIRRYGCYADKFIQFLSPLNNNLKIPITFTRYNVLEFEYPQSLEENDCYFITGSQYSTYEDLTWIKKLEDFIQQCHNNETKLVGICFGHQLIAQSLGGKVEKNTKGWELGVTATHITRGLEWMQPSREFFFSLVSHQDQVSQLPEHAINFAETNLCPYSGFTIDKHILTLQGHPEFSKNYVKLIIKLQSKNLSSEQHKSALSSLNQSIDSELILAWIFNFLKA